jgi:ATP-dependent exoDNAse (exonuclease V) alpha subunit
MTQEDAPIRCQRCHGIHPGFKCPTEPQESSEDDTMIAELEKTWLEQPATRIESETKKHDAILTSENRFFNAARAGENILLAGQAGTGKSHLLKQFIDEHEDVIVTAPTGVAALNIQGVTIHRWSGIGHGLAEDQTVSNFYDEMIKDRRNSGALRRIREAKTLIIDEISMLGAKTLDLLDFIFKRVRGSQCPFGGIQIITCGDFLQLPPINDQWAFESEAWKDAGFAKITMEKVWRQDEPDFLRALCGYRTNTVDQQDIELLTSRINPRPSETITRLLSTNNAVDDWNNQKLRALKGDERLYRAETCGKESEVAFLVKNLLTPELLRLKEGAIVMFTANDPLRKFVNGSMGRVACLGHDMITVETSSGTVNLARRTWAYQRDKHDTGKFTQFPVRLAYAATIHKCQGMTMDAAHLDISRSFCFGQSYVALSRIRTLAGLTLASTPAKPLVCPKAAAFCHA